MQPSVFARFANMKSTPRSVAGSAASGRTRAPSMAGSRAAASVRTASAPAESQANKKAKPTPRAASTRSRTPRGSMTQASKCAVCAAVPKSFLHPHGKTWHETTKQGDVDVAIGPICLDCHGIMIDQVPEVDGDVPAFVKLFKSDPDVKEGVQESIRINGGGKKTIDDENVYEVVERGITIDRPYVFFPRQNTSMSIENLLQSARNGRQ